MADYTYLLSAFAALPAGTAVNPRVLRQSIGSSSITPALGSDITALRWLNDDADPTYQLTFDAALDSGELVTLGNIIAAHVGYTPLGCTNSPQLLLWGKYRQTATALPKYITWYGDGGNETTAIDYAALYPIASFQLLSFALKRNSESAGIGGSTTVRCYVDDVEAASLTVNLALNSVLYEYDFSASDVVVTKGQKFAISVDPSNEHDDMTWQALVQRL